MRLIATIDPKFHFEIAQYLSVRLVIDLTYSPLDASPIQLRLRLENLLTTCIILINLDPFHCQKAHQTHYEASEHQQPFGLDKNAQTNAADARPNRSPSHNRSARHLH